MKTRIFDCNERNIIKKEITRYYLRIRIEKVKKFIDQNINRDIDIKQLAEIACISDFHFIRVFNELCGCTPYQYLIKKRIERAKKMLNHNLFSVLQISQECGYDSVQTFRKCFKRETGLSPKNFYKNHLAVA